MKYWTFEVKNLIADYNRNQRTLASIEEAINVVKGYLRDPLNEVRESEIELYLRQLEHKQEEYQWWVDMVTLGLNDLPEVERLVLKYWLIDQYSDRVILQKTGVKDGYQLNKIKTLALAKFHDVVLPN